MPSAADVESAAATILVVAAAALRAQRTATRRDDRLHERLYKHERELRRLRDRVERWSGLP